MKPFSLISNLAASKQHNQISKLSTKCNFNDSFPGTIELPYYRETDTNMRPSIGWWLSKYHNDAEMNLLGKSIFAFLTQSDVLNWERENHNTLLDYRYRVMKPLIARRLDVNLHESELYSGGRTIVHHLRIS